MIRLKTFARIGWDGDVWPVVLLLFAVVMPAVCLLWFMNAAMRNEQLAARQKLADAYRSQLVSSQTRLDQYWKEKTSELEKLARTNPPSAAFSRCLQSSIVDSVIVFDEHGKVLYPNTPSVIQTASGESDSKWAEAGQLEYLRKDFIAAANRYDALAKAETNASVAARALQGEARCLVQAGQKDTAIWLVDEIMGRERYNRAFDPQGRLIVANAELMVLELLTNRASAVFQSTARRLQKRLMDYENPALAASQRRFLMKELQKLIPDLEFPTLAAEELAAEICEKHPVLLKDSFLHRAPIADIWQFSPANNRVLALVHSKQLRANLLSIIADGTSHPDADITLLPPDADSAAAFVTLPAGDQLPGWRLALSLKDQNLFDATAKHRTGIYLWTAVLVMAAMGVLSLLAIRLLRRQTALARLKNNLAATVSHELKTPLSSMRVLVDTLLDSDKIDEQTAREYLQLIAQENERLSRLIQNFLTFSRMERKKHAFHFAPIPARQIIGAAVAAVRERFDTPGCHLAVEIHEDLPAVMADSDALATALINLLDNAFKYSEEIKHIVLSAHAENGKVIFSVQDNGTGIAPRETKKIFSPFHQADQRLSRKGGGCGLGLSIVQFIVSAHHGSVSVESEPGHGSTFTISLPAFTSAVHTEKEAIA